MPSQDQYRINLYLAWKIPPPLTEELLTTDGLLEREIQVFSKSVFPGTQMYMTGQIGVCGLSANEENEYKVERLDL